MKTKLISLFSLLAALLILLSACTAGPDTVAADPVSQTPAQTEAAAAPSAGASTQAETILDLAYALSPGEALEGEYTLTGTVTQILTRYNAKYDNLTVEMVLPGQELRPIQCYRLTGENCAELDVGDMITVTGRLQNYKGTVEFDEDCRLDHVLWGIPPETTAPPTNPEGVENDDSKEAVAAYIHENGCLPPFYMTKNEAEAIYGWEGGPLDKLAPGMAIGGDRFTNYQKVLPTAPGRTYTECDIDTIGANARGAKRIVFSNDGLVYYTDDHYDTFELLYGEP